MYFSLILFNMKLPTNSQTSAPLYAPVVKWNSFFFLFSSKVFYYDVKLKHNPNKKTKKKQKKEHNMVQSTIQQKCGNESSSLLFKIIR